MERLFLSSLKALSGSRSTTNSCTQPWYLGAHPQQSHKHTHTYTDAGASSANLCVSCCSPQDTICRPLVIGTGYGTAAKAAKNTHPKSRRVYYTALRVSTPSVICKFPGGGDGGGGTPLSNTLLSCFPSAPNSIMPS